MYCLEGGGIAYKGQVLKVQQSNMPIHKHIPPLPTDLPCVLIRNSGSSSDLTNFRDFTINVEDIMEWLRFLKIHHPMYKNIDLATANERASRLETMSQDNDQGSLFFPTYEPWILMKMMTANPFSPSLYRPTVQQRTSGVLQGAQWGRGKPIPRTNLQVLWNLT